MTRPCKSLAAQMDSTQRIQLEAAAFRQLLGHLQKNTDVQNIDLMLTGDFCRNCLAKWYASAGKELGIDISYDDALVAIYGMPYPEWKTLYQKEATPEQLEAFKRRQAQASQQP